MLTLDSPLGQINAVAAKIAPKLKKLGPQTVGQLLQYFPFRWEDWSQIKAIGSLEPNTTATVKGTLELIQNKRSQWKKRLLTEAIVADNSGSIKAIWFHQPYLTKNLRPGDDIFLSGKVEMRDEGLQFVHPQYERLTKFKSDTTHTARIVPIYPLTKNLTAKQLRYVISRISGLAREIKDWLPQGVITKNNLLPLTTAVSQIHFPDNKQFLNRALERIKFDELFLIQLRSAISKEQLKKSRAPKIDFKQKETQKFVASLPFRLTNAQKVAGWEILRDLQKSAPMNRLLEGDVGSGKTVVAALAILNAGLNKLQTAYMAPTEILAQQHFKTLSGLFKDWGIKIGLLTSGQQLINTASLKTQKTQLYKLIGLGKLDLVIGTHALIQDKVGFKNLGLVIVDEQHRFGVEQRKSLKHKNTGGQEDKNINNNLIPHLLSMTATPIPRSLALTVYGDLDLSVINELPAGRKKIKTEVVVPEKRPEKYKFILNEIRAGRQVFVICPLIDPSDKLGVKAAKEEFEKLDKKIFPDIRISLLHGKMKTADKERTMSDFIKRQTMILVSTPVIEVGIDVPNASVMVVESAERFGLAQLHQFRGRVGRASHQSYCFLFSETDSAESLERLRAIEHSNNGFELAEADLKFRGPGEIYGIKQSGYNDGLKVAKLTDYIIIKKSRSAVDALMQTDPRLNKFPAVKEKLKQLELKVHFE